MDDFLNAAIDRAFEELDKVGGVLRRLSEPFRTLAIITSAQSVIDNGGLRNFFETDWPLQPPYKMFSDAYRMINATAEANAIDAASTGFNVSHPESCEDKRCAFLSSSKGRQVDDLDATMTSDVWERLTDYAEAHRKLLS